MALISFHFKPLLASAPESVFSLRSRSLATRRSLRLKYVALSGLSGMYKNTKIETMMLGNPSTRKRRRHAAMGSFDPTFVINHAMLLAKDVAKGAAEMKSPTLKASSSRLKKNDMKNGTPTNAASPTPRAARSTRRDAKEKDKDCNEAIRPHDATHNATMIFFAISSAQILELCKRRGYTYDICEEEKLSKVKSSIQIRCKICKICVRAIHTGRS